MDTMTLERFLFFAETRLKQQDLAGYGDAWVDPISEEIVLALVAEVYGKNLGKVICKVPKNWWQHFKLEVFPDWLLRIAPVEFEVVEHDLKQLFPSLRVKNHLSILNVDIREINLSDAEFDDYDSRFLFVENNLEDLNG